MMSKKLTGNKTPVDNTVYGKTVNRVRRLLPVVTVSLLFVLLSGQMPGLGGKQETKQWGVESHDKTNFPLVGRHRTVSCRDCHLAGVFEGTPTACEFCHWERKQDDRYELRLGIHCGDCHVPFTWKQVASNKWNHETASGYPLEGVHRTLDCIECHSEKGLLNTAVDCFGCHENDYRETRDPDHTAAGFSMECHLCHFNNVSWSGGHYAHVTYLLKGQHKVAHCSDCHSNNQYKGLPSDCVFCHQEDYNSARDPDHRESRFPLECETCHGDEAITWEGAAFDHSMFPLIGRHRVINCVDCHSSGQYKGLPSVCVFCHLEEYLNAGDPDHKQLGFHTDCEVCHGTDAVSWENVIIDHNQYWPIKGAHSNLACSLCHVESLNLPTDCLECHKKDYNSSVRPNHKKTGFPTDCEMCHFSSHILWSQAVFDHSFPINAGRHAHKDCHDCHVTANYHDFSCLNCHTHDKTRMDFRHGDVPGYSFNSQACYACHPQGRE